MARTRCSAAACCATDDAVSPVARRLRVQFITEPLIAKQRLHPHRIGGGRLSPQLHRAKKGRPFRYHLLHPYVLRRGGVGGYVIRDRYALRSGELQNRRQQRVLSA